MKKDNYLIFAHFHSSGLIRNDILKFLIEGNSFFKKIIFVSTNLKISEKKISKISKNYNKKKYWI